MKTKNKAVSTTTIAMITSLGLVVAAVAAALPGSSPQPQAATQSARQRILFDSGWRFQLVQVAGLEDARPIAAWRVKEGPQGSRDPAGAKPGRARTPLPGKWALNGSAPCYPMCPDRTAFCALTE
jgi:hypothetical protein